MEAELIDYMGDDLRVVNAARVSFDKESLYVEDTDGNVGISEKDTKLIKYLAKNEHWTPSSHVMITMRETVPIFVARQRFKHVVGFTYNEVSRRYVSDEPEFYKPNWRRAIKNVKQGSGSELSQEEQHSLASAHEYERVVEAASNVYHNLLLDGICPEQARMVLPQSMYTSYYVTGSLAAWARAYQLRSDPHSQKEIQDLAQQWNEIISPLFPISWEALTA